MSLTDTELLIDETLNSLRQLLTRLYSQANAAVSVSIKPSPIPINTTPPSGTGSNLIPTPKPFGIMSCVLISKIIDEKPGAELDNVVLSLNDFNILKQNDHIFTVIPSNPAIFQAVPTIGIHDLTAWIANNSITKVPNVPADNV